MTLAKHSDTIVIQTFRNHDIPAWIQRCLDSVRNWAALHRHDYALAGDEFYELCGPDYLARGNKNPQAITNLARLVATRRWLDEGYAKVIWMDADVFVFDPAKLTFDLPSELLTTGYAFGREVWLYRDASREFHVIRPRAHNAATFFTQAAVDLDMLIALVRHIDAKRQLVSNYQVGVKLLRGLHFSFMFPTFSHVGVFSPDLLRALVDSEEDALRLYGQTYRFPAYAGNLGLSLQDPISERVLCGAIDRLEESSGQALNQYATETGVHLIPYESARRGLCGD